MEQEPNSSESWNDGQFPADVERSLNSYAEGEGLPEPLQAYQLNDRYGALNPYGPEFNEFQKQTVKSVLIEIEGEIDEVVERLHRAGVQIDDIDIELGIITATIDAALEADYRNLRGVQAIHPSSEIDLF